MRMTVSLRRIVSHHSRQIESRRGLAHFGVGNFLGLGKRLVGRGENHVFDDLGVGGIQRLRINFNGRNGAVAFGDHLHRTAATGGFHGAGGKFGLYLFHLLLHFRSLLHEFSDAGHKFLGLNLNRTGRFVSSFWKRIIADWTANLNAIFGVEQLLAQFLRLPVVRLIAPGEHGFLGFKFDNRNPLAVIGREGFDADKTGHFDGEAVNLCRPTVVFLDMLGTQTGAKEGDDHCAKNQARTSTMVPLKISSAFLMSGSFLKSSLLNTTGAGFFSVAGAVAASAALAAGAGFAAGVGADVTTGVAAGRSQPAGASALTNLIMAL